MNIDSKLTMSSREIADLTGKEHFHVKRDIESMFGDLELDTSSFGCIYIDSMNRKQTEYALDKELTLTLVAGYNTKMRLAIIQRWQELEEQAKVGFAIPKTYAQALMLAATQAAQIEEQQKQLEVAAPKVEFVDKYVDTKGNLTFREVAKLLKVNERRFRHFLKDNKIMYELHDGWAGYSKFIKNGMIENVTGFNKDTGRAFSTALFTPKGFNYVAGFWKDNK